MDLTNVNADFKECKKLMNAFRECFSAQKHATYVRLN